MSESGQRRQVRHARLNQVEALKSLESGQRRQVLHAPAIRQVQPLKSLEPCQWGEVRELSGLSIVGPFKIPCLGRPEFAQVERLKVCQLSQAGRELAQSQVAEVQDLGLDSPSLLDPPLCLNQIPVHDDRILSSRADPGSPADRV